MECWIYLTTVPSAYSIIFSGPWSIRFDPSGNLQITNAAAQDVSWAASSICNSAWHHIAAVINNAGNTSATLFVDGVDVASNTSLTNNLNVQFFQIGGYGTNQPFPGEVDEVALWPTAKYTSNFTPPPAPYTGTEGMVALYHLDSNGSDSSVLTPSVFIAPNNAGYVYSPGNWNIGGTEAIAVNFGAYMRTLFSGSAANLQFDTSKMGSPATEVYYRINGYNAQNGWQLMTLTNGDTIFPLTMPSDMASAPWNFLEMVVKCTSDTYNAWVPTDTPWATCSFLGIEVNAGSTIMAPGAAGKTIYCYGDSITAGIRTVNDTGASDPVMDDAMMEWSFELGRLLGAEIGMIGFGGEGWLDGSFAVNLAQSYNYIYSGVARTFSPPPDLIVINMGTNDDGANTTANVITVLDGLLAATPSTTLIAVLQPFNVTNQTAYIQAAIGACSNPGRVTWIPTTGFFNTEYGSSDGVHPLGPNALGIIAPLVAEQLQPLLYPSGASPWSGGYPS